MCYKLFAITIAVASGFSIGSAQAATNLVVCTEASPPYLNAAGAGDNVSFDVTRQFGDTLVEVVPGTSELRPSLAESWSIAADGKRVEMKLRRGVHFQSLPGFTPTREMNADDVIFTFDRVLHDSNPFHATVSRFPGFEAFLRESLASVGKIDETTVVFTLRQPSASFLSKLSIQSFAISSKEYADQLQRTGELKALDTKPVGTGPFTLVDYQEGAIVRFAKFNDYWGSALSDGRDAKIDNLIFAITPDAAVRLSKLRTGECQVARYPSIADLSAIEKSADLQLVSTQMPLQNYVGFNNSRPPFNDPRVRKALALAMDVGSITEAVFQGRGTPAAALIPPALWGHYADLAPRQQNLDEARRLLAEAGYRDGFKTEIWPMPVGRSYMPDGRRAAALVQADWAKIGVDASIVSQEFGEFLRRVRADEASVVIFGHTWDFPDPSQNVVTLTCDSPANANHAIHFCSQQFDAYVKQAEITMDRPKREELYKDASRILYDDVALVQIANVPAYAAIRKSVKNFVLHPYGGQSFAGVSLSD